MVSLADSNAGSRTERWSDADPYRAFGQADAVRSILVLKVDHVGDFILGLDALLCLRRSFPRATIDLVCGPWNTGLAKSTGLFGTVYDVGFFHQDADGDHPSFDPQMLSMLRGRRWDLAIDLRVDHDTRVMLKFIDSRWKAGFESPGCNDILTILLPRPTLFGDNSNIAMNQTMSMLRLIRSVADFFHQPDDVRKLLLTRIASGTTIDLSIAEGRYLVVCNSFSGRTVKNWPLSNFKRLVSWMANELGCVVVLVGNRDQETDAKHVVDFCESTNVISAAGRTTLQEAIGIVAAASLYIGNDSGLTHAASKLGIPAVALFSGVDPTEMFAPLGSANTILRAPVSCAPCHILNIVDCIGEHACVTNISEDSVRDAVLRKLFEARLYHKSKAPDTVDAFNSCWNNHIHDVRHHSSFNTWIEAQQAEVPQRYCQNLERYLKVGGCLDLQDMLQAFKKGNPNNRGDLNRFYTLALIFDQIMKEQIRGDVAELGVYKGNTAYMLVSLARRTGTTAYLLDTFEGFSASDLQGIDVNKRMEFTDTSLESVQSLVGVQSAKYVKGYFPDTSNQIPADARFSLVHIDCDLYAPFNAALNYFYPRLVPGGFMIMHDYSSLHWDGAERAVDEFFADKPESILPVPDGSGTVMIRKAKPASPNSNWFAATRSSGFANAWINVTSCPIDNFLVSGWGQPESWGTWGIGNRHVLMLMVLDPPESLEIDVESQLPLMPGRDRGRVQVYVGENLAAEWDYSLRVNRAVRLLKLSRSSMQREISGLRSVNIEFRPDSWKSPHELDPANTDTRPLGLGLLRFRQRRTGF